MDQYLGSKEQLKQELKALVLQQLFANGAQLGNGSFGAASNSNNTPVKRLAWADGGGGRMSAAVKKSNSGPQKSSAVLGGDSLGDVQDLKLESLLLTAWERMEAQYKARLEKEISQLSRIQQEYLQRIEKQLQLQSRSSLETVSKEYRAQLDKVRSKENAMWRQIESFVRTHDKELSSQRKEILTQFHDIERMKIDLEKAEDTFFRHESEGRAQLRIHRDQLRSASTVVKQRQASLEDEVEHRVEAALRDQQMRHLEKLRQLSDQERRLQESVTKIKQENADLVRFRSAATEKDESLKSLTESLEAARLEIQRLRHQKFGEVAGPSDQGASHPGPPSHHGVAVRHIHVDHSDFKSEIGRLQSELFEQKQRNEADRRDYQQQLSDLRDQLADIPTIEQNFSERISQLHSSQQDELLRYKAREEILQKKLQSLAMEKTSLKSRVNEPVSVQQSSSSIVDGKRSDGGVRWKKQKSSEKLREILSQIDENSSSISLSPPTPDYVKSAKDRIAVLDKMVYEFQSNYDRYLNQKRPIGFDESSLISPYQAPLLATNHGYQPMASSQIAVPSAPHLVSTQFSQDLRQPYNPEFETPVDRLNMQTDPVIYPSIAFRPQPTSTKVALATKSETNQHQTDGSSTFLDDFRSKSVSDDEKIRHNRRRSSSTPSTSDTSHGEKRAGGGGRGAGGQDATKTYQGGNRDRNVSGNHPVFAEASAPPPDTTVAKPGTEINTSAHTRESVNNGLNNSAGPHDPPAQQPVGSRLPAPAEPVAPPVPEPVAPPAPEPLAPLVPDLVAGTPVAPAIDPVLQQYMAMVLQQRNAGSTKEAASIEPTTAANVPTDAAEEVEIAEMDKPASEEDFW